MSASASPGKAPDNDGSSDPFEDILRPEALDFVARLARSFAPRIRSLLAEREVRYRAWRAGEPLRFRNDTAAVRDGDWRILSIPRISRAALSRSRGPSTAR